MSKMVRFLSSINTLEEVVSDHSALRMIRPSAKKLERSLATTWAKQGREFIQRLSRYRNQFPAEEAVRRNQWEPVIEIVFEKTSGPLEVDVQTELGKVIKTGAKQAIADVPIEITFDPEQSTAIRDWLKDKGAEKVQRINAGTKERMRTLLGQAADEGWSWSRTAREIEATFRGFAKRPPQIRSRAELVSVTELTEAYEAGHNAVRKHLSAAGVSVLKRWLTVGDDRVDPDCLSNQAAGAIPWNQAWPSGVSGPPDHPGCRCVTTTVTE